MNRANGQAWIDKNSPYRLKYKANNNIYSVDVSSEVIVDEDFKAGTVVAFKSSVEIDKYVSSVRKAKFPQDLENVIGVVGSSVESGSSTAILKTGVITLDANAINEVMYLDDDAAVSHTDDPSYWIGAPVYWFIGRTKYDNTTEKYTYEDSSEHKGCLTISTPSGVKWKKTTSGDDSLNVGYDNLPIIGTISAYKVGKRYEVYDVPSNELNQPIPSGQYYAKNGQDYDSATGNFESDKTYYLLHNGFNWVEIYLNINKFDSSLEWNWPYLCKSKDGTHHDCGKVEPVLGEDGKKTATLTIRHGLFPDNKGDSNSKDPLIARNYCDIIAIDDNDNEYVVNAGVENFYGTDDEADDGDKSRRTEIYLSTPETYRYRISGRVNYKFDKKETV